jgi:uracil-DNA glycosylase family 4
VPDQNAILKEMGITQWVLRDAPAQNVSDQPETKRAVSGRQDKPAEKEPSDKPAPTAEALKSPEPERTKVTPSQQDVSGVSLDSLRIQVTECTACELASSRKQTVFGEGPDQADWLFIGEAPGQQEDRQGKPFVGRAGGLLTQMIRALDATREQVFIVNMLKCRPPDNRDPLPSELKACEPFLLKQIQLVQPKVIVALGKTSAQALLKSDQTLGKLRGQVYQYGPDKIPLIVSYHPAYLLRQPADKGKVWADLLLAHRQLPV